MSSKLIPVMDLIGASVGRPLDGPMNDHKIDQAIYALVALSATLAVVLTVNLLVQLHAEGSELLSWILGWTSSPSWSG